MSKKDKQLARIEKNLRNVSLEQFESLIKKFGYIEVGKHPKAIIGEYTMPYKRENPIKKCYVKELLSIIKSLGKTED